MIDIYITQCYKLIRVNDNIDDAKYMFYKTLEDIETAYSITLTTYEKEKFLRDNCIRILRDNPNPPPSPEGE